MKFLVVGGGSGGHITPAVATIREILDKKQRAKIEFWTDRKYYKNVVKITTEIGIRWGEEKPEISKPYIRVRKILSGKFRRYAGWGIKDYFKYFDLTVKDLILGNFFGFLGFLGGIFQSFFRLVRKKDRPDVIFLKGGFVGLPVGIVARLLRIPYVVHESDRVPGMANRILMKHAKVVAMGMKFEEKEGRENWEWVGIPIAPEFRVVKEAEKRNLKKVFGFDPEKTLLIVTGGSQGAENINLAMRKILPELLKNMSVGLVAGRKHYENMIDLKKYEEWDKAKLKSDFRLWEFNSAMHELMGAADIVVSRAGATTIAELAALRKAVILVPFERLPGAHQVKNAEELEKNGAVISILDGKMNKKPEILLEEIKRLARSPKKREEMAGKLHEEAKEGAAERLAEILIGVAEDAKR